MSGVDDGGGVFGLAVTGIRVEGADQFERAFDLINRATGGACDARQAVGRDVLQVVFDQLVDKLIPIRMLF